MGLPWARLDVNIASHDKMLNLLSDPAAARFQASASYMFGIAWSVGHGTDGRIPAAVLPFIHGTKKTADLLVHYGLWLPATGAWIIPNFADYQQTTEHTRVIESIRSTAGTKANCVRWHGPHCWKPLTGCSKSDSESDPKTDPTDVRTNGRTENGLADRSNLTAADARGRRRN